jgi:DNA polymerase I-like protein with 3'-5' exonuclease and polymerase domains
LSYCDFTSQEFAIAGYLSGDTVMIDAYESGRDVYLAFGARAGLVPDDATKATHGAERKLLKAALLGSQYGLGADGLAYQIGRSRTEARELLEACRRASPAYWRWSDGAVRLAMTTGRLDTCLGWATVVHPRTRPTSLLNWPIQSHAAEMLRLACCMLTERDIRVCAPVHDAVLVEAPADRIDEVTAETRAVLAEASGIVLGGPSLRSDAQTVRFPDRLLDDDSRAFWVRLTGYLGDAPF